MQPLCIAMSCHVAMQALWLMQSTISIAVEQAAGCTEVQLGTLLSLLGAISSCGLLLYTCSTSAASQPGHAAFDDSSAIDRVFIVYSLQGVHKIVKKHDKLLPHAPCQQFYIAHLHHQPWVQVPPAPSACLMQLYANINKQKDMQKCSSMCNVVNKHGRDLGCLTADAGPLKQHSNACQLKQAPYQRAFWCFCVVHGPL